MKKELNKLYYSMKLKRYKSILQNIFMLRDMNEMNDLGLEFYGFTKIQDEIGFLLHSDYLLERIEYLIAKPIK